MDKFYSAEAAALDVKFDTLLQGAQTRGPAPAMTTEESIRAGKAATKIGRQNSARTLRERIKRHELVVQQELAPGPGVGSE